MAFAFFPLNPPYLLPPLLLPSSSSSVAAIYVTQRSIPLRSDICCSVARLSAERIRFSHEESPEEEDPVEVEKPGKDVKNTRKKRRKRNLSPSFNAQTLERWSVKVSSSRSTFPWQDQKVECSLNLVSSGTSFDQSLDDFGAPVMEFGDPDDERGKSGLHLVIEKLNAAEDEKRSDSYLSDDSFGNSVDAIPPMANNIMGIPLGMQSKLAPWAHGAKHGEDGTRSRYKSEALVNNFEFGEDKAKPKEANFVDDKGVRSNYGDPIIAPLKEEFPVISSDMNTGSCPTVTVSFGEERFSSQRANLDSIVAGESSEKDDALSGGRDNCIREGVERFKDPKVSSSSNVGIGFCVSSENSNLKLAPNSRNNELSLASSVPLPWEREIDSMEGEQFQRSNTELAERTIPEPELQRLRNVALRMKERMTVGPAGVTEAVVKHIHEKWKEVEVAKLRFEGPACLNMKRTHEILERKTGGVVIWRSGRSVVLYRGMAYQLPCIQTYLQLSDASSFHNPSMGDCSNLIIDNQAETSGAIAGISEADSMTYENLSEGYPATAYIDSLLEQLGPRCKDWSGRNPLPVDADLLPSLVPGYKPPFRLLPYKTRRSLRDKEMTVLRRLAGTIPPHFVLGMSRL